MSVDYSEKILTVKDLEVQFNLRGQVLTAIRGISLDIYKGESLAIVGESGSGKSVFTKTFMGLLDNNGWIDNGHIYYHDYDLTTFKKEKDWTKIRGQRIAMVFQDPMTSLNPLKTVGKQIQEAFTLHNKVSKAEAKARTLELLADVGIPEPEKRYKQYPHEFSGGMRQRVVIAIAMACVPEILICDEPTTALDVTIQAQILELMQELRAQGQVDASQVAYGVLETNGQLSLLLMPASQPATAAMLGMSPEDAGYAHIIINDGRILDKNLSLLGRDRRWLDNELKRRKIKSIDDVYILTLSETGSVFCQTKEA